MCIVSHHNISLGITNQGSISIALKIKKKVKKRTLCLLKKLKKAHFSEGALVRCKKRLRLSALCFKCV